MSKPSLTDDLIISRIFVVREQKVMFDFDLAMLYQTETRILKQAVRRNLTRFPPDFMFQLTKQEWQELITTCDNLGSVKFSPTSPFAFTEHGVVMLASLLNSPLAIEVSLFVVRTFVKLRNLMVFYKDLASKIDKLEYKYDKQLEAHEENLRDIVEVLRTLMAQPQEPPHRSIGFKANTEE